MGKASAPATPDYAGAAQQTAAGNLEMARTSAKANRVNYNTPYGSLNYSQNPNDQDQWTADVSLSPAQQALMSQQDKTSQNLANMTDSATSRVGDAFGQALPESYDPTKATNTAYESIMARLNPTYDSQQSSLDAKLANQGLTPGSEAWRTAQTQFGQTRNDAQTQAALQAINLGMNQQGQTYTQSAANRNIPINELNALRTGSQVTNPTFGSSAQQAPVNGPDLLGAAKSTYDNDLASVNAQNKASGGLFGGLGALGDLGIKGYTAGLFSDRRLKTNIRHIGDYKGHNLYSYEKFGKQEIGVMAQEVMCTRPDAVMLHDSGFYLVNYEAL